MWTEHEDSVYTAEWSAADPWTFASLSYDGRLVLGHVPQQVKFSILNLGWSRIKDLSPFIQLCFIDQKICTLTIKLKSAHFHCDIKILFLGLIFSSESSYFRWVEVTRKRGPRVRWSRTPIPSVWRGLQMDLLLNWRISLFSGSHRWTLNTSAKYRIKILDLLLSRSAHPNN